MDKPKIVQKEDLKWERHPQLANVEVSYGSSGICVRVVEK